MQFPNESYLELNKNCVEFNSKFQDIFEDSPTEEQKKWFEEK